MLELQEQKNAIYLSMNRFYQGDWIDSMASRFVDELQRNLLKNSFLMEM